MLRAEPRACVVSLLVHHAVETDVPIAEMGYSRRPSQHAVTSPAPRGRTMYWPRKPKPIIVRDTRNAGDRLAVDFTDEVALRIGPRGKPPGRGCPDTILRGMAQRRISSSSSPAERCGTVKPGGGP